MLPPQAARATYRAAAWSCNRFVLSGGYETLNLLQVLMMQALDCVAERLSDLA